MLCAVCVKVPVPFEIIIFGRSKISSSFFTIAVCSTMKRTVAKKELGKRSKFSLHEIRALSLVG